MVRFLYLIGICALLAAAGVSGLCIWQWHGDSSQLGASWPSLDTVQGFRESFSQCEQDPAEMTPPLVAQAEALAAYLNPPKSPDKPSTPALSASSTLSVPSICPAAPSVKFRLHGTSYYPNQPGRSMALIAELGAAEGNERWVKEGSQVGHFVIHEIRHGAIVYRDGDNLQEMAIEPGMSTPAIVRDLRPGARQVSAAVEGVETIPPAGPNSIEIAGGN